MMTREEFDELVECSTRFGLPTGQDVAELISTRPGAAVSAASLRGSLTMHYKWHRVEDARTLTPDCRFCHPVFVSWEDRHKTYRDIREGRLL